MDQEIPSPPSLEPPKKRSNTGLLIGLLVILFLCCVCVIFPIILYQWLGDFILNLLGNSIASGSYLLALVIG